MRVGDTAAFYLLGSPKGKISPYFKGSCIRIIGVDLIIKVAPPSPANALCNFQCNSKDLVSIGSNKRPIVATSLPGADKQGRGAARRRPGRPPGRGGGKRGGRGGARRGGGFGDSLENRLDQ